jgi:transcriptional regulator with XRE-family HTH domain
MPREFLPAHVALGRAVREVRLNRSLSQEQLALESRLQSKMIYQLEPAKADPRYGTLLWVAGVLGVRVVDLLRIADELEARASGRRRVWRARCVL